MLYLPDVRCAAFVYFLCQGGPPPTAADDDDDLGLRIPHRFRCHNSHRQINSHRHKYVDIHFLINSNVHREIDNTLHCGYRRLVGLFSNVNPLLIKVAKSPSTHRQAAHAWGDFSNGYPSALRCRRIQSFYFNLSLAPCCAKGLVGSVPSSSAVVHISSLLKHT